MDVTFFVSLSGHNDNPGSIQAPFASLERAQEAVREARRLSHASSITVMVRAGTYYLEQPLAFQAQDSGDDTLPVLYTAYPGERVTLSGGRKLDCQWQPYRDGIWVCPVDLAFTQLFANGKRQVRARYPNYDPSNVKGYSGYLRATGPLEDGFPDPCPPPDDDMTFSSGAPRGVRVDPAVLSRSWARPQEAIIHIYQGHHWGNLQWRVRRIDPQSRIIWFGEGGQQMGAKWALDPCAVDQRSEFFIENVFEELDSPGEWYLDTQAGLLYYLPEAGMDLALTTFEVPLLESVFEFNGTQQTPVHHITLGGFRIAHTSSTFLADYEVPSLSDWAIHRGGSVFLQGAQDCAIQDCWFDAVGGNAVFMSNHNRGNLVRGCRFTEAGDSAICFVGSLETTVGTQRNFPFECRAEDNLIHDCGVFGKQIAGIYISRARRIAASHNEIHHMPRAGICIGDGTWGGHVIEYNRIYATCRETGDHGPFNAWGRDRYWCLGQSHLPYTAGRSHDAGNVHADAMETVKVRHNRFEEEAGWGLDLDDGASNYEIYNNLCLGVSLKLREGAYRTIYNNIWVNGANSPCFHVGNEDNHDRYFRNITVMSVHHSRPEDDLNFEMGAAYGEIYTLIAPPAHSSWLEEVDYNCFFSDLGSFAARVQTRAPHGFEMDWKALRGRMEKRKYTLDEWQELGFDRHSIFADPLFIDPQHGDYRVKPESPALKLGFINFDSREAGLTADFPEQWRDDSIKSF